jgi:hypothetical protein
MWALIFSREETVREAVVDAVFNLYLRDPPGGWVGVNGGGKQVSIV